MIEGKICLIQPVICAMRASSIQGGLLLTNLALSQNNPNQHWRDKKPRIYKQSCNSLYHIELFRNYNISWSRCYLGQAHKQHCSLSAQNFVKSITNLEHHLVYRWIVNTNQFEKYVRAFDV